jgi:GNAT superfamily N-acetyltransferase
MEAKMDEQNTGSEIRIRLGEQSDAALLAQLGRETFTQAFGAMNTPEDLSAYLAGAFHESIQAKELAQPGSCFLIAEVGGEPAGYARLLSGSSETCITGIQPIELVRIYALDQYIGKGVGTALMRFCLEEGRKVGHDTIWLGVWEKNTRAIAFYQKWSFSIVGRHQFELGSDIQTDFVMERSLSIPFE